MTRTSPLVSFGLYALAIKQDASLSCSDLQIFSHIDDLITNNINTRPIIAYEPDFWLLDGGYKFRPVSDSAAHIGLMSLSQSDASGDFSTSPELVAIFGSVQSSDGLTLRFAPYSNDFCTDIDVAYYDATNTLIRTDSYTPTSWQFSTSQDVDDFKKIIITFNTTNNPYRYLRLSGIDFGELLTFTAADIKSCTITEEINPLSLELPINTMDLTLFSSDAAFSIINPTGIYASLQEKQPLDVYEQVGSEIVYMGQYYLDKWENQSDNEIIFHCIDKIGLLDSITYMGGFFGDTINHYIDRMMNEINMPYEIDSELIGVSINGYIEITTYREALKKLCLSVGAYATCSRSGVLQIKKMRLVSDITDFDYSITKSEKGIRSLLTLKKLITGVEVQSYLYTESPNPVVFYEKYFNAGIYTIVFNVPQIIYSISGATLDYSADGGNYAIINVASAGTVEITGTVLVGVIGAHNIYNEIISPTVNKNVLRITDATTIYPGSGDEISQRIYDYYQQRYSQKTKLFVPVLTVGDSVLVETLYNQQIGGIVEKMTIDLARGFTAEVEIIGVVQ